MSVGIATASSGLLRLPRSAGNPSALPCIFQTHSLGRTTLRITHVRSVRGQSTPIREANTISRDRTHNLEPIAFSRSREERGLSWRR